jgi:hypothetical protein
LAQRSIHAILGTDPDMFHGRAEAFAGYPEGSEAGDQTAGARLKIDTVAVHADIERQAIGNDHQSSAAQIQLMIFLRQGPSQINHVSSLKRERNSNK